MSARLHLPAISILPCQCSETACRVWRRHVHGFAAGENDRQGFPDKAPRRTEDAEEQTKIFGAETRDDPGSSPVHLQVGWEQGRVGAAAFLSLPANSRHALSLQSATGAMATAGGRVTHRCGAANARTLVPSIKLFEYGGCQQRRSSCQPRIGGCSCMSQY